MTGPDFIRKLEDWAFRSDGVLYSAIQEGRVRVTEGQLRVRGGAKPMRLRAA